jgi:hypothetical protein
MTKFYVVQPEVYCDEDCDHWMSLADIAKISRKSPAETWRNWSFVLVEGVCDIDEQLVAPVPRVCIASTKTGEEFYMDPDGNVVDENGQRTGFCVNGAPEKTVGSWEDIYVPEEWALATLKHIWEGGFGNDTTREEMHPEYTAKALP